MVTIGGARQHTADDPQPVQGGGASGLLLVTGPILQQLVDVLERLEQREEMREVRLIGRGTGENIGARNEASISSNGETITRPFDYSLFSFQLLDTVDVAFNHYKPKTGFQFVITGVVISGNRDIGVNGSICSLYTANSATSATAIDTTFEIEVPKSTVLPFVQPNTIIGENVFLNSKCDDNSVRVGVFGYFVPTR